MQSSGRGGAGNIVDASKTPKPPLPEDLQTPTLKTSLVTTGRGGTGNVAAGLDAEEKRRRQDVEPYAPPPFFFFFFFKKRLTHLPTNQRHPPRQPRRNAHRARRHGQRGQDGGRCGARPGQDTVAGAGEVAQPERQQQHAAAAVWVRG
jgi:hypothetical protein